MSGENTPQLRLFVFDSLEQPLGKRKRDRRHVKPRGDERLACGHRPLPTDGRWVQYPLSMKALLTVVDCPICQAYLKGIAAVRVVRRSVNRG